MKKEETYQDKLKRAKQILKMIAWQNGVTPEEVYRDIEDAIQQAITLSRLEGNHAALEKWAQIPHAGEVPTPEEVIIWVAEQI